MGRKKESDERKEGVGEREMKPSKDIAINELRFDFINNAHTKQKCSKIERKGCQKNYNFDPTINMSKIHVLSYFSSVEPNFASKKSPSC